MCSKIVYFCNSGPEFTKFDVYFGIPAICTEKIKIYFLKFPGISHRIFLKNTENDNFQKELLKKLDKNRSNLELDKT